MTISSTPTIWWTITRLKVSNKRFLMLSRFAFTLVACFHLHLARKAQSSQGAKPKMYRRLQQIHRSNLHQPPYLSQS